MFFLYYFLSFFLHHAAKRASKITLRIRSPSAVFARNWTARRVRAFFERSWAAWVFSNQSEKTRFLCHGSAAAMFDGCSGVV